jgi:polyisoprenoid-binding protein YceI
MTREFVLLAALATAASASASDYRFDPVHTQVLFSVSHLGFSRPQGRLHVKSGFIHFDENDWGKAKVEAEIDTTSLDMGDATWNAKLRSWEFFGADKHPSAQFVSDKVEKTGERSGVVHGRLTLLGVSRPLDLTVTFNRAGMDSYSLHYTAGFSATATLKRSDFGMKKYLPDVGDEVSIQIEAEGLRDRDAQEQAQEPDKEH